jgi:nicotinamidase-related amidase
MESSTSAQADQGGVALLIIDVQRGLFHKSTPIYRAQELLQKINMLVAQAHQSGVPVFYIQHSNAKALVYGSPDWQLHPQLQPQPADGIIHKLHGNAFEETSLGEELHVRQITRLVVTGLVTHGCVKATCIGARELGYQVTLVEDAHSSYSKDAARLIAEWNQKLQQIQVALTPAAAVNLK